MATHYEIQMSLPTLDNWHSLRTDIHFDTDDLVGRMKSADDSPVTYLSSGNAQLDAEQLHKDFPSYRFRVVEILPIRVRVIEP